MPRLGENCVPRYRLHKQSGQAIVTLNGKDVCLGKFNTPESKAKYRRLIADWISAGSSVPAAQEPPKPTAASISFFNNSSARRAVRG